MNYYPYVLHGFLQMCYTYNIVYNEINKKQCQCTIKISKLPMLASKSRWHTPTSGKEVYLLLILFGKKTKHIHSQWQ